MEDTTHREWNAEKRVRLAYQTQHFIKPKSNSKLLPASMDGKWTHRCKDQITAQEGSWQLRKEDRPSPPPAFKTVSLANPQMQENDDGPNSVKQIR